MRGLGTDYTAMGYWENKQGIAGGRLAPMYTHSQLVHGPRIDDHKVIAERQGVDSRADYTQGDYDYVDTPTAHEVANAAQWKLSGHTDLAVQQGAGAVTSDSIKAALATGKPVVIGIPVYSNFYSVTSANHGYYGGVSGSLAGYHAITALGYSATGLRIENQWGTGWGERGFATLSWSFVDGYVFQATSVGPLTAAPIAAPAVATSPVVSGTASRGQTLTGTAGTWTSSPVSYTYQWQRYAAGVWSNIVGATATSYALQVADETAQVRLRVTATNAGGSTPAYSQAVGPVAAAAPALTAAPAVSGTAARGSVLRGTAGTWSGAGNVYTYQWQRDTGSGFANIPGATGASYTLQVADGGAQVRLRVIANNPDGHAVAYSAPVGPVSMAAPVLTASPAVTGTARRGSLLLGTTGTWTGAGNIYTCQWQRYAGGAWSNIIGATGMTYTLQAADVGAQVRLRVIATNPGGYFASYSHATATVA